MTDSSSWYYLPSDVADQFYKMLSHFDEEHANFRLWAKDSSLFTGKNESLMLDWLDEPMEMIKSLPTLEEMKKNILSHNFSTIVLMGMGGSSLSCQVFQEMLAKDSSERFFILDTIHPDTIARLESKLNIKKTLFIVASKSGSTLEPNLLYHYFLKRVTEEKIPDPYRHFLAITDPVTPLEQEAVEQGFLKGPFGKPGIGGRYSALSPFGIFPALLMGIDVKRLLKSAIDMAHSLGPQVLAKDNKAALLGAFLATNAMNKKDIMIIHLSPPLVPFGKWLEQLMAESLGKNGMGIVPVIADGTTEKIQSSNLVHLFVGKNTELSSMPQIKAYLGHDTPIYRLDIDDIYDLSALMYCFQVAVAFIASVLKVNPFDQPDVERSKERTKEIINKLQEGKRTQNIVSSGDLSNFFACMKKTDYCAILSYLDETEQNYNKLYALKSIVAQKTGIPIMLQSGPRYLHSTGQLFKGGKNNGHFLVITGPYSEDRPSGTGTLKFSDIHKSQALGDVLALKECGRRVWHSDLDNVSLGLDKLIELISTIS